MKAAESRATRGVWFFMPCLLGCLAQVMSRVAIVMLVIFSDFLGRAYHTWYWPLLGFFFMPATTLAYAWAMNSGGGRIAGVSFVVLVCCIALDLLGLLQGGGAGRRIRAHSSVLRPVRAADPCEGMRENIRVRR